MSKGNMLLGHARGKVGSLVFSRSNGQQIVRARAEVVKNPQTTEQMIQRIILNTVAQAYSKMSAITDHSFEGIQTGQKSMSYFMRKNMEALRAKVANISAESGLLGDVYAFTPVGQNGLAANEYVISKGTLPEIRAYAVVNDNTIGNMTLAANTYQGVLDQYGLQRGDQLTFVTLQEDMSTHATTFHYARIILDPMNEDGTEAPLSSAFIVDGAVNLPNVRNEGSFATLVFDTDHIEYGFNSQYVACGGIIVSRKNSDGSWLRSNCTMFKQEVNNGAGTSMGEALDMLATGDIATLNSRYLNNSGTGNVASTGSGTITPRFEVLTVNGSRITSGAALQITLTTAQFGACPIVGIAENLAEGTNYELFVSIDGGAYESLLTVPANGVLNDAATLATANAGKTHTLAIGHFGTGSAVVVDSVVGSFVPTVQA